MSRNSRTSADPVPKSDIVRARDALVVRILEGDGTAPQAQRRDHRWRVEHPSLRKAGGSLDAGRRAARMTGWPGRGARHKEVQ
jgi:hypothetical protein